MAAPGEPSSDPRPPGSDPGADLGEAVGLEPARYDRADILAGTQLPYGTTRRWWRAMGIVEVPDGVVAFSEADLEMARRIRDLVLAEPGTEEHVLRLARLLGGSSSRIAEAQVAVLEDTLADAELTTPAERLALLRSDAGRELVDLFESSLRYVWRRHLFAALGRWVGAEEGQDERSVGFADISGFSAMSKRLGEAALAPVIEAFEATSLDVVSAHDGRVVKFIGDEVMYTVRDVPTAVDVALELLDRMGAHEPPVPLHCGIAHGSTVTIGGDVFGETVNLAKRLTSIARRGRVVVTRADARALEDRDDLYVSRVRRVHDLKGVGRVTVTSVRRRE